MTQAPPAPPAAETRGQADPPSNVGRREVSDTEPPAWVKSLASLRLTVVLFALSIFLVFAGTLAQAEQGIWAVLDQYFRTMLAWIDLRALSFGTWDTDLSFPYPGGWLLGALLLVNLMAAHVTRFTLSWKRAGILMIHSGLIILLLSEVVTGLFAVESQMTIGEGQTVNFSEDVREIELAIVDKTGASVDRHIAIDASLLAEGATITDPRLPFPVTVKQLMPNADLRRAGPFEENAATAGIGTSALPIPRDPASGTETSVDHPAAYVEIGPEGNRHTYLLSTQLVNQEIEGSPFEVALRFKRIYKPYLIHLIDLKHEKYLGTDIPRNFESEVRLVDPFNNVDRRVDIYMNHPLRYAGDTLYQYQILGQDTHTVLQVVTNPGWLIPYVSCVLVGVGLLYHFVLSLVTFSGRRSSGVAKSKAKAGAVPVSATGEPVGIPPKRELSPYVIAGVVVGIAAAYLCMPLVQQEHTGQYNLQAFAELPVVDGGRVKPIDSLADNSLMALSKRTAIETEDGEIHSVAWLLDVLAASMDHDRQSMVDIGRAAHHKVFRIENEEVQQALSLPFRDGFRYSLAELAPQMDELQKQLQLADAVDSDERSLAQRKFLELGNQLNIFFELVNGNRVHLVPPVTEDQEWQPLIAAVPERVGGGDIPPAVVPLVQTMEEARARNDRQRFDEAMRQMQRLIVGHRWQQYHASLDLPPNAAGVDWPALQQIGSIINAWAEDDPARFNASVAAYQQSVDQWVPGAVRHAELEELYNRINPLVSSMGLYVLAFLLAVLGWLIAPRWFHTAALWLIIFLFVVHTAALLIRMDLMNRPWVFVTNLYSSAIFVGWGAVLTAIILEWFWRNGIGTVCGAVVGFCTLLVAYHLEVAADGETMEMLRAVLDTNFWLATHVTTITLGYAATFLAGMLGIIYIVRRFDRNFGGDEARSLTRMTYGTICFALLLSFVGTVLGGIWADQSWGRFWGWDPKENGALIIVIWNALILHARFGGLIKQRGIAVLAVFGNIVTAWSWFGVNMLGVGLHSYGFMDSAAGWMILFALSQLAIMALGLLPLRRDDNNGPKPPRLPRKQPA